MNTYKKERNHEILEVVPQGNNKIAPSPFVTPGVAGAHFTVGRIYNRYHGLSSNLSSFEHNSVASLAASDYTWGGYDSSPWLLER